MALAASQILVEGGDLTHRKVAARAGVPLGATTYYFANLDELRAAGLEHIAHELDASIANLEGEVRASHGDPAVLAGLLHEYLSDHAEVAADTALYLAAVHDPELRPLARRWFEGLIALATRWVDPTTARMLALYIDGAGMYASLHDEPLTLAELTAAFNAILLRSKEVTS